MMRFLTTVFFLAFFSGVYAQQTVVKGRISDRSTGLPLSHINIEFDNSGIRTLSDAQGQYTISTKEVVKMIHFSSVGHKRQSLPILRGQTQEIHVSMESLTQDLAEVGVTANKKPRYRNKDNPAVEFMRRVIERKDSNSVAFHKHVFFEEYEKLCMSLSLTNERAKKSKLLKKYKFLADNKDTIKQSGKTLVPIFMQEKLSAVKQSLGSKPDATVLGEKQSRIDQYLDEDGINEFLDKIYQHVDIYDHDIGLGNQRFLSPIAEIAPQFYKYFILDTIKESTPWQLKLMVSPKNKQDVLFAGYLYVSLDGAYAVQRAELSINNQINLNWVKDLQISLEYAKDSFSRYHLSKSTIGMDLGIFKEGTSIYGERTITANKFCFGEEALDKQKVPVVIAAGKKATKQVDGFWQEARHEQLSATEVSAYANIDSLKNSKSFKRTMALASSVMTGFVDQGPVEIGPLSSLYSFSPIEGSRFKIGARTTDAFSRQLFFDVHVAYGTKDQRWKYNVGVTHSLTSRSIYEFPVRSISVRHSYETQIPGQNLNFLEDDNFLLSFKRGVNDKWMYNRKWAVEYLHETASHVSLLLSYKNQVMQAAGKLRFQRDFDQGVIPPVNADQDVQLSTSEFVAELRWAPNEKFYQGKRFRRPINNGHPVFTLAGAVGVRGLLGGDYNYQNITLNVAKRFYLSQLGFSDVIVEGGAVFGKVPFPLLSIHRANQTYAYQLSSYNLMNFMEFMSDRYASINVQHSFNGFFLNKIPLIKKLQWREVASIKVLEGSVSTKNRQDGHRAHYRFPSDESTGRKLAYQIDRNPYIEGSLGLSNIFKVLRVDVVKRFTHLDHPGVTPIGVRAKISVDF